MRIVTIENHTGKDVGAFQRDLYSTIKASLPADLTHGFFHYPSSKGIHLIDEIKIPLSLEVMRFAMVKDTIDEGIDAYKGDHVAILDRSMAESGQEDYHRFYVSTGIENFDFWKDLEGWNLIINSGIKHVKRFGVTCSKKEFIEQLQTITLRFLSS